MSRQPPADFLSGVIEGFYGPPWVAAERFELFDWMGAGRLNTYMYAPKDDLKHRALWRELYSESEASVLRTLIAACQSRKIRFIYALSPGLDIRYSSPTDLDVVRRRFAQMLGLGCEHFALLLDDIPDRMYPEDATRWNSFAAAQCHVANEAFRFVRERAPGARFLFCPTPYCGRMAERNYGGAGYLETIGRELAAGIDVFWTGPEIISREIPVRHIRDLQNTLRRKPLIWDNLFANDYDGRRFYCGPYTGRPLELRQEVSGLLLNPNNEFPLNLVPLHSFAEFTNSTGDWNPRQSYLAGMREWLPHFATVGQAVSLEALIAFGDCFYLPYEEGPEAESLFEIARCLLYSPPTEWGERAESFRQRAGRLRDFCVRMTELRERPLFYALSRRVWELREELDLLDRFVQFKSTPGNADTPFGSDFHLPQTYRGGLVARLQRILLQQPDGAFLPKPSKTLTDLEP